MSNLIDLGGSSEKIEFAPYLRRDTVVRKLIRRFPLRSGLKTGEIFRIRKISGRPDSYRVLCFAARSSDLTTNLLFLHE
jgi:hypothetical protein